MSYLWVVTFDVVVSLADAGAEDATALATSISEELADDSLAASIEAAIGVAVQVVEDSIAVVQATSSPTRFPTTTLARAPYMEERSWRDWPWSASTRG